MRLVTLDSREVGGRPGIVLPSGDILDLAASPSGMTAAQWRPQSVVSVLAEGDEGRARVSRLVDECERATDSERLEWRRNGRLLPGAGTRLLPPIRRPGLLLMVTDSGAGGLACYVKNPNSAVGPGASVPMPVGAEEQLYMIAMVGIVLGRPLFRGTPAEAARAMRALTLVADLGTRRVERGAVANGADARQFPGACVLGPALVTLDEWDEPALGRLRVLVNNRQVGTESQSLDAGDAAARVSELSGRYAFRPGDVVGLSVGIPEFELPGASRVSLALGPMLELGFTTAG